jgi:capsular polysaccharide biosynthesis protein
MLNTSTNSFTDSFKVSIFLYKWRKTLLILALSAAVLSAIFSSPLFISPLYKSSVIMYPASSNSISKSLLTEYAGPKKDILEFGTDEQTEQMLQILNSNRIRDKVISRFKLAEHYGIKPEALYYQTRLYNRFNSNITFKRTEFMAVKISVLDKDPQLAADIANEIANLLDSVKNDMQKERAMKGFKLVEAEYISQQKEVDAMEDSLTKIRMLGIQDYETQAEMLNRQLAKEIANGNTRAINAIENKLQVLAMYGGSYVSIRDALVNEKKQLSFIKARYEEAKMDAYEEIPQKFIVENAYKAERKSYPIIWIIVLLSTLGTLLAGMLVIYMVEKSPEFLQKLKQT